MASSEIHPTAIIEPGASIGEGSRIGAYCHVGSGVRLGRNNIVHPHVVLSGNTLIGESNEIYPFCCFGTLAEDFRARREWKSYVRIGDRNIFREYTTVNASVSDGGSTIIGSDCFLLSYSHVAHDCVLGDKVTLSCDAKISGHVRIGANAIVSAKTGVVQFVRIGTFAFVGGFNKVAKDILPYCIADGYPSAIRGINKVGLERGGFSAERIRIIRDAYRTMLRLGLPIAEAVSVLAGRYPDNPEVREMIEFARTSKTGLARPRDRDTSDEA
jgi:UDP-N-acetylglucosamine acyltransferase